MNMKMKIPAPLIAAIAEIYNNNKDAVVYIKTTDSDEIKAKNIADFVKKNIDTYEGVWNITIKKNITISLDENFVFIEMK